MKYLSMLLLVLAAACGGPGRDGDDDDSDDDDAPVGCTEADADECYDDNVDDCSTDVAACFCNYCDCLSWEECDEQWEVAGCSACN